MAKIYVASSWRNHYQLDVVNRLRSEGHEVYDFKEPAEGVSGFSWAEIDPKWRKWTADEYRRALAHPRAMEGYAYDMGAMQWADTCVLVLPCGRSAHLELGWMAGAGKRTIILTRDGEEPELMAKMATRICTSMDEVCDFLKFHNASILGFRGAREAVKAFQEDPFTDYHQMVADFCGISREMAKPINLGLAYGEGQAILDKVDKNAPFQNSMKD